MKIGSVKFFKVLILAVLALSILVPLVFAIIFGYLYYSQKKLVYIQDENFNQGTLSSEFAGNPDNFDGQHGNYTDILGSSAFGYQQLYPDLYTGFSGDWNKKTDVCYLTFDDGPSAATLKILDVLDEFDIKATFFVTGKASEANPEILKKISDKGHCIGVHSYSHDYKQIYASVDGFLEDFNRMHNCITDITGVPPEIFRFAGGSVNAFNQKIYPQLVAEMLRRGFVFYDWNAAANDAVNGGISRSNIVENVLSSAAGLDRIIVLMHDRPDNMVTAEALPDIIQELQKQGYKFDKLTNEVEPVTYYYDGY